MPRKKTHLVLRWYAARCVPDIPSTSGHRYVQTAHNSSFGEISLDLSVHQLDVFGINTVEFRCQAKVEETEAAMCKGNEAGVVSNAFNLLMGSGMTRDFVPKKTR